MFVKYLALENQVKRTVQCWQLLLESSGEKEVEGNAHGGEIQLGEANPTLKGLVGESTDALLMDPAYRRPVAVIISGISVLEDPRILVPGRIEVLLRIDKTA